MYPYGEKPKFVVRFRVNDLMFDELFSSLEEAEDYCAAYDGKIYTIEQIKLKLVKSVE